MNEAGLNYRVAGRGEPLLLVHGFGISFPIWECLVPLLCPHFSLVMIELPGIGASCMPEGDDYLQACVHGIQHVRETLGIEKWTVLGYSTGSRIAEAYVCADAEHVRHATFLCPLIIDVHRMRAVQFGLWLDHRIPAFGTWILSGWRLKYLISWLGFNLQPDPRRDAWYAHIGAAPVGVLKETIRAVIAACEGSFSVPVRYSMIWGDQDLVPLRPRMPGKHDHFVHGRHAAPMESADEIAHTVVSLASGKRNPG